MQDRVQEYTFYNQYLPPPPGGARTLPPMITSAADDAGAQRQAHSVALFAINSGSAAHISIKITNGATGKLVVEIGRT
jgi:hypothetical protein